jgi:hypothetical protein
MDMQNRLRAMSKPLLVLVVLTAGLSMGAIITNIGPAANGQVYGYTRMALGIVGAIGVSLLIFGKDFGRTGLTVVVAWALAQSLYFASEPDGNYTRQVFDGFMGLSNETTVNGEVTDHSAIGLNLVGLFMLGLAYSCRTRLVDWKNRATRGFAV